MNPGIAVYAIVYAIVYANLIFLPFFAAAPALLKYILVMVVFPSVYEITK